MRLLLVGLIILAGSVYLFFHAIPGYAQGQGGQANVQIGGQQQVGTTTTEIEKVGPNGERIHTTTNSPNNNIRGSEGYKYSGLPGKWKKPGLGIGEQPPLAKDNGPNPRYTLERLPPGANSEEALWVKMDDGKLIMVDPKITQKLR